MKTVAENKTAKSSKKVTVKTTTKKVKAVKEEKVMTAEQVNAMHKDLKAYSKSSKGVRAMILSGKADDVETVTPFTVRIMKETRKNTALWQWFEKEAEYKGVFTKKDGTKGHYSKIYGTHRAGQCIARLANDKGLQIKLGVIA
jgi:hypothetical protein